MNPFLENLHKVSISKLNRMTQSARIYNNKIRIFQVISPLSQAIMAKFQKKNNNNKNCKKMKKILSNK